MPRLRQVPRAEATANVLEFYDLLFGERDPVEEPGTATGTPGNWWTTYALSPAIFDHAVAQFRIYGMFSDRKSDALPPTVRELGLLRAGYAIGSVFVYSQHSKVAREVGLSADKVAEIGFWQASKAFSDDDRVILAYVDALLLQRGQVPDQLFDRLQGVLTDQQILELSYHTMIYAAHATLAKALKLEFDDVADSLKEIPEPSA